MKKMFILIAMFACLVVPSTALAIDLGGDLLGGAATEAGYDPTTDELTFARNVGVVVRTAISLLGIVFTVLLVYAGFYWMLARGDEEKVKKAQAIISAAIIGLIIVVAAYSITYFVLEALLGPNSA